MAPIEVEVYKIPQDLALLKCICGIYFLVKNKTVEYVGRSVNINNRLMGHHVFDRHHHDEVWIYRLSSKDRWRHKDIERELIRQLDPPKNINGTARQSELQRGKKRCG